MLAPAPSSKGKNDLPLTFLGLREDMTWFGHDTESLELDAELVFDPRDHRNWDGDQASLHAMTTYTQIVQWARTEIETRGLDPTRYQWSGGGLSRK